LIAFRAAHLIKYQDEAYAKRYTDFVGTFDGEMREAVALGYHKLLSYKDEYEVARLLMETRAKAEDAFDGDLKLTHHLAPPLLSWGRKGQRPRKFAMPQLTQRLFPMLARMKRFRGTTWDVFGRTEERRMERDLIGQYERDLTELRATVGMHNTAEAIELARLPLQIRGFGPVKVEAAQKAALRRTQLLEVLREEPRATAMAV